MSIALSEHGLSNLYDVLKSHSISANNIWVVGEDKLREWNVPENDVLDYKRIKAEYQGKYHFLFKKNKGEYIVS